MSAKTADEVARRTGLRLYSDCGHNYLADHAAAQLAGRSHYYDAGTRCFFKSRVNQLRVERVGLLLCTVESVEHPSSGRVHRAVVFDLLGSVIYRSLDGTEEHGFKCSAAADRDLSRWLSEYQDEAAEAARVLDVAISKKRRELAALTD